VDAIAEERRLLENLREIADISIDTSDLNIHELTDKLREAVPRAPAVLESKVTLISFGYKFGIPLDADIIIDVRFLPNPYWVDELKGLTGLDPSVRDYVVKRAETQEFIERFVELVEFLIPRYERERKPYVTIGIGCTGGRHRSVVLVNELTERLQGDGFPVMVIHRDVDR